MVLDIGSVSVTRMAPFHPMERSPDWRNHRQPPDPLGQCNAYP